MPYLAFFYLGDILSHHINSYIGGDLIDRIFQAVMEIETMTYIPSFYPRDLLVGLVLAGIVKLILYSKGKNAKKFRQGTEYGSASMEERLIDKAVDLEKLVAVKMQIEALNKALDKLSPEEREIIQALFFDEIPQRELAKTLNISQGAVFRRKEKTLEKLKVFLEDWDEK